MEDEDDGDEVEMGRDEFRGVADEEESIHAPSSVETSMTDT